jgi:hypothetical protein
MTYDERKNRMSLGRQIKTHDRFRKRSSEFSTIRTPQSLIYSYLLSQ